MSISDNLESPHKGPIYLMSFLLLVFLLLDCQMVQADDSKYFAETGHTVSGKFLQYWNTNGGLAVYGFPITDVQSEVDPETGKSFLTQWFERNRFELHPENAGTKYEVLLGLLGKDLNRSRLSSGPFGRTNNNGSGNYYNETGHNLGGRFLEYWSSNGGLERFGFPISDEFQDVDPETGKTFAMQWFERARFEKHPENGRPYDVLLGLLGKQLKGGVKLPDLTSLTKVTFSHKFFVTSSGYIGQIAVDPQDNLYLADIANAKILKYDSAGDLLLSWDVPTPKYDFITGGGFTLRVDPAGNIYAGFSNTTVIKYNSSGAQLSKIQLSGSAGKFVAVDSQGNLYAANAATINKYSNSGQLLRSWLTHPEEEDNAGIGPYIAGLVVGNNGMIYLLRSQGGTAYMSNPRIQKYDVSGNFVKSWVTDTFPIDLGIDRANNLYFLYSGGSACRFWGGATKFGPDGGKITEWGQYSGSCDDHTNDFRDGVLSYGSGISIDTKGNIYTVDHPPKDQHTDSANRIQKFNQS